MKNTILLLLLSILLCSCGGNSSANKTETLVVGTYDQFEPFAYLGGRTGTELIGFDIDLAREIARDAGKTLEIEVMDFGKLIAAVEVGEVDIALCGITMTDARKKVVTFSMPYHESSRAALILRKDIREFEGINTIEELGMNARLGAQNGTVGNAVARQIARGRNVLNTETVELLLENVLEGNINAAIVDSGIAKSTVDKDDRFAILPVVFESEYYGVAINNKNRNLLASVNRTLNRLMNSGQYQMMVDKYINND